MHDIPLLSLHVIVTYISSQEEIKSSNTRDVLCARMLHGLSYEQLFESMLGDTGFVIVCVLTIAVTFGGLVA